MAPSSGGLAQLGYGFAYRVLDAQYIRVDGFGRAVPQRRRRVFVVGHLGDWRRAAAVLFERESLSGNPAPRRQPRQDVAPTLSARTQGGGGLGTDFDLDGGLVARALTAARGRACAHDHTLETYLPVAFGGGNQSGAIDVATAQTAQTAHGERLDFDTETFIATRETAATLTRGAESGGKGGYAGRRQEDDDNLVAHALRADGFDASEDGTGRGTPPTVQDWRVRRLTPTECERLQGFPDRYTLIQYPKPKWAPKWPDRVKYAADGPRYKALGNSMAVNAMRWIGHRIDLVDRIREFDPPIRRACVSA